MVKTIKFVSMPVSGRGGTETVLTKVLNHLAEQKNEYNIILYLTQQPTQTWLDTFDKNIEIHICKDNKLSKLFYFTKIFSSASNDDHFVILGANIIPFANKMRKWFNKQYKITSWIHYSLTHQKMFNPYNLLQADDHWAISSSIQQQLLKMGVNKENIHLIFNPIENQKETITLGNEPIRLIYVGRLELEKQKNLQELFHFLAKNKNIQANLFGKAESSTEFYSKMRELNVHKQVMVHEWTPQPWKEIAKLKPTALIMTSNFEGLPMVSLEALSYGVPCILANFDGAGDVITNGLNGYLYQQHDLDDLKDKVQLVSNGLKQTEIKKSIQKFYYPEYFKRLNKTLELENNQ